MINWHDGSVLLVNRRCKIEHMSLEDFESGIRYLSLITPKLLAINVEIEKNSKSVKFDF
jgi:hypothetical protein